MPLSLRVLFLSAERADQSGLAIYEPGDLDGLLRHEGDVARSPESTRRAIRKAFQLGYVTEDSHAAAVRLYVVGADG